MPRRTTLFALLIAGVLALGAGVWFGASRLASDERSSAAPLLALSLPDLSGKDTPLAQWKDKLLIVNFWATWCVPCREEMPEFVRAQKELGGKGVQFVGIAVDEAVKVRQFAGDIGLNYPALLGGYGAVELSRGLGNRIGALPFTVFVKDGTIVHTQLGPLTGTRLRSLIDKFG
jgi:thiol-disulfide isomerase/thioredoxin